MRTISMVALVAAGLLPIDDIQAQSLSDNVVKIGFLTDMSGGFADLADQRSVGAASMAIADYKKEMNPAFAIELVHADRQNKADTVSTKIKACQSTLEFTLSGYSSAPQ